MGVFYEVPRIDETILFNDIDKKVVSKIVDKRLEELGIPLEKKNRIFIKIVNKVVEEINIGESGARKINAVVDKEIEESKLLSI